MSMEAATPVTVTATVTATAAQPRRPNRPRLVLVAIAIAALAGTAVDDAGVILATALCSGCCLRTRRT